MNHITYHTALLIGSAALVLASIVFNVPRAAEPALCKTVEGYLASQDLTPFGPAWEIRGPEDLGHNDDLPYESWTSVLLGKATNDLAYDHILAQMSDKGPMYFFFDGPCVAAMIRVAGEEA